MERIFVEGKPDEVLVNVVRGKGFSSKEVRVSFGKSRVYNDLKKRIGVIGLVDEDPSANTGKVDYKYEHELIFSMKRDRLKLYEDKKRENRVIVLEDEIEPWLINISKDGKLDFEKHKLLIEISKRGNIINYRLDALEHLLEALLKLNNKSLLTLKEWLR